MKKTIIIFASLLITISSFTGENNMLTVKVKNFKNSNGDLRISLFNSEGDYLKNEYSGKVVAVENMEMGQVVFKSIPSGSYAIVAMHDENGNSKMDKNFLGIPKEDYCFSNNARGLFGPPSFDEAKFEVNGDTLHEIKID